MRIKIWGSRGSLPAPYSPDALFSRVQGLMNGFFDAGFQSRSDISRFLDYYGLPQVGGYGGNTPCLEVSDEKTQIIIDGGSGIRLLGYEMMNGLSGRGKGEIHILFTHFHWDHLMGLPFFTPFFIPGNRIHIYAVQPELPMVFQTVFRKPFFPVPLEQLPSKIEYHRLQPRKTQKIGDIQFTPYQLDHPDPCWGFRFESNGKVFSHCVDTEAIRVSQEELGPDLPLYQGVDLMVFDAQYTLMETIEKINWGHAAASIGLDLAMREGVKRVLFMHHDPASSDEKIAIAEKEARRYYESQLKIASRKGLTLHPVQWEFAHEGMVIDL